MQQSMLKTIDIDLLVPRPEVRGRYPKIKAIEMTAASERGLDVFPPVQARQRKDGGFEILSGIRVWLIAQKLGQQQVTALIKEVDEQQAVKEAVADISENGDIVATAKALDELCRAGGLTKTEVGQRYGLSRSAVSNLIRLLDLKDEVLGALSAGKIKEGHARQLIGLSATDQRVILARVVSTGLTVRDVEKLVKALKTPKPNEPTMEPVTQDDAACPEITRIERELSEVVGSPVSLLPLDGGGWRVTIDCFNMEIMDGVMDKLGYHPND